MWKVRVVFGGLRPVSLFLEKLCAREMTEEAGAPSAKRPCTEGRNTDHVSEQRSESAAPLAGPREEEEDEDDARGEPFQRIKRKKCALLLSYNGRGYLGMQRNHGVKTIEAELLEALAMAGAYPDYMKDDFASLQFQRCSRTDKSVSAARQVVSLKIMTVAELANKYLPPEIRIMGFRRVTKSFNSKTACSARSYEYVMPTYAFAPYRLTTLDYRIDDSTIERVQRLLKIYEKNHNFHNFTSGKKFEEQSSYRYIKSFTCGAPFISTISTPTAQSHPTPTTSQQDIKEMKDNIEVESPDCESRESGESSGGVTGDGGVCDSVSSDSVTSEKCQTGEKGSRETKEVEFVTLQVKGQSFMIHQIRKMVGLIIAIIRGFTPETTLIEAFKKNKVDIPRAPALGLLLDNVYYDGYNKKFASDESHDTLDWQECDEKIELFKKQYIYRSIVDTEIREMSMMQWLGNLQIHEFYQTRERLAQAREQGGNQNSQQEEGACPTDSNKLADLSSSRTVTAAEL